MKKIILFSLLLLFPLSVLAEEGFFLSQNSFEQESPMVLALAKKTKKRKRHVSQSSKKNKSRKTSSKTKGALPLELFFNFGVGPSLSWLTAPLGDEGHYGVALDLYLAIPQKIVAKHRARMPKGFQQFVNSKEEMIFRPWYLTFLPTHITLSPKTDSTGIFGFTWSGLGFRMTHGQGQAVSAQAGVDFPTVSWKYISSDHLRESVNFFGLGVTGFGSLKLRFSETFQVSAKWTSELYLPIRSTEVTEVGRMGETHSIWHIGTAAILFHKRFRVLDTL